LEETTLTYEHLMEKFVNWAQTQPDIHAAIVVGSQARLDHPADEWADLDIIIYTTNPEHYLKHTNWMADIGNVWVRMRSRTVSGEPEWLTTFENGLDVDFVFNSYQQMKWATYALFLLQRFPQLIRFLPKGIANKVEHEVPLGAQVFDRGIRVLLDKNGLIARMRRTLGQPPSPMPPTEAEFLELIHRFWSLAGRKAKKICRGELYIAQSWSLNHVMLPMIEWHAHATHGWEHDTWYDGRFLEEWADPRILEAFFRTFAHYGRNDMSHSLLATMDLFRWLATETANRLGYQYPTAIDERITKLVESFFQGNSWTISVTHNKRMEPTT
jgi:aminoglycoside 6-adenylyltransferase